MKIFLCHSPSDYSHCRVLKYSLLEGGHSVIDRTHPLELSSMLTTKGKQRISQSDLGIVLLTANAIASYRVHQEVEYLREIRKDYLVIENFGHRTEVKEHVFATPHPALNDEEWRDELEQIKLALLVFTSEHRFKDESIVYHVSKV